MNNVLTHTIISHQHIDTISSWKHTHSSSILFIIRFYRVLLYRLDLDTVPAGFPLIIHILSKHFCTYTFLCVAFQFFLSVTWLNPYSMKWSINMPNAPATNQIKQSNSSSMLHKKKNILSEYSSPFSS